jgi:hypothetical protein
MFDGRFRQTAGEARSPSRQSHAESATEVEEEMLVEDDVGGWRSDSSGSVYQVCFGFVAVVGRFRLGMGGRRCWCGWVWGGGDAGVVGYGEEEMPVS